MRQRQAKKYAKRLMLQMGIWPVRRKSKAMGTLDSVKLFRAKTPMLRGTVIMEALVWGLLVLRFNLDGKVQALIEQAVKAIIRMLEISWQRIRKQLKSLSGLKRD